MSSLAAPGTQCEPALPVCWDGPAVDGFRTCGQCDDCATSGGVTILVTGDVGDVGGGCVGRLLNTGDQVCVIVNFRAARQLRAVARRIGTGLVRGPGMKQGSALAALIPALAQP